MREVSSKSELYNHLQEQQYLVFTVTVVSQATAANKKHYTDIPGVALLRTQGKTAEADAVEDVSAQVNGTATDSTGVFGILIDDQCKKLLNTSVTADVGTVTCTAEITTGGRILLNCDSNQTFASQDVVFTVAIAYLRK